MKPDLHLLCQLLYNAYSVPVYFYKNQSFIAAFPPSAAKYPPRQEYIDTIRTWNKLMVCYQTDFTGYYGYMYLPDQGVEILLGPVSSVNYPKNTLYEIRRRFLIPSEDAEAFSAFLATIPLVNTGQFVNFLTYSYYLLTGECITMDDLIEAGEDFTPLRRNIHSSYLGSNDDPLDDDDDSHYINIYRHENRILAMIEHGNIETLGAFPDMPSYPVWETTDNIRYLRYGAENLIVNACRAAIRGGLSCSLAFRMQESYIKKIETANTAESLGILINQSVLDFTTHVSNLHLVQRSDNMLMDAIRYIHENFMQPISVNDVAAHVGYSRTYLAKKFREELNFDISSFIRRCRLEHAKELLIYTDKPLSEISSFLCFSSQSHFQKAFKDAYNITPLTYRRMPPENESQKNRQP